MIDWDKVDNNISEFNFKGKQKLGKVVDVYDGDTIKIVFPITDNDPHSLFKWNCRLINIDTPEIRTKNLEEKKLGIQIRDILRDKILNKLVIVECHKFDKYGRLLVEVCLKENELHTFNKILSYLSIKKYNKLISINDWLIENEYAKPYSGGKREQWII